MQEYQSTNHRAINARSFLIHRVRIVSLPGCSATRIMRAERLEQFAQFIVVSSAGVFRDLLVVQHDVWKPYIFGRHI